MLWTCFSNNFRVEDAEGNNLFVDTRQWPPRFVRD